jgi:hypothetical protein
MLICACSIGIVEPLARRMGVPATKQLVETEKSIDIMKFSLNSKRKLI